MIDQLLGDRGDKISPFISVLEGGEDGPEFEDLLDFWYSSQIMREAGGAQDKEVALANELPVDELPNIMKAMGHFPSNMEAKNSQNEFEGPFPATTKIY